jgi:hypothetical protein
MCAALKPDVMRVLTPHLKAEYWNAIAKGEKMLAEVK